MVGIQCLNLTDKRRKVSHIARVGFPKASVHLQNALDGQLLTASKASARAIQTLRIVICQQTQISDRNAVDCYRKTLVISAFSKYDVNSNI